MPVRKRFDNFEDPHGYHRILGCRKLLRDEDVDAASKREKNNFLRIARKAHSDKLSGTPDKESFAKLKKKYEWAYNAYQKFQWAYEILGDVDDDGTYLKRVNYDKKGEALSKYFPN